MKILFQSLKHHKIKKCINYLLKSQVLNPIPVSLQQHTSYPVTCQSVKVYITTSLEPDRKTL